MSRAKPIATLDCETDPFKADRLPEPFIWGLYLGHVEDYWEFETAQQVVDFLSDKRWLVYAHNGGKFDYHFLKPFINSDEPLTVISGRIAKFRIGECEFRDSMNILVNPLRVFAKEEIDYAKLESAVRAQHMDEIKRYLRSDCVNLYNTIAAYNSEYGRSLTQAGASMRYWRDEYEVPMISQTTAQAEYYRKFYYGGRVQCFTSGHKQENFSVVDINSAYPYAMLQKHPITPYGNLEDHLPPDPEIGPCMIRLKCVAHGCFPLKGEDHKLYFPYDESTLREYSITGWEFLAALEHDAVKNINILEVQRFENLIDFQDYINHFYEKRKEAKRIGDKAGDIFAKLFMNSLYGKFAANPEKYKEYVITHADTLARWCVPGLEYFPSKPWGDRILMERDLPEDKWRRYNVCTAASITGFVRAHLFKAMQQVSGLLYCDTDSIAARDISRLPLGPALGQWKHEFDATEYAIAGKKLYAFRKTTADYEKELISNKHAEQWKVASKGVKLSAEEIIRAAKGESVLYRPEVPTFSFAQPGPVFINREVKNTFQDISHVI
jgi:hypothetical protein